MSIDYHQIPFQMLFSSEMFLASVTLKGFLSSMYFKSHYQMLNHMHFQMLFSPEMYSFIWSLSSMYVKSNDHMLNQMPFQQGPYRYVCVKFKDF